MTISVIVVTYNQENTISRTLDSILAQDVDADFEIIIGDDDSTDDTEMVCRDYAARYPDKIVYLRRDKNMGVTANYFDCIARARGRYLADCAGDDYWTDTSKLRHQLEVLETNPAVSLVATDWLCRDESTGTLSRSPQNPEVTHIQSYPPRRLLVPVITNTRSIHLCSALYRKDIIDRAVKNNPDIFIDPDYTCEDLQILLEMANAGSIVILPGIMLHYSVGHPSVSHQTAYDRKFEYSLGALRQMLRLTKHFDISYGSIEKFVRQRVAHIAAMAFRSGEQPTVSRAETRPARLRRFLRRKNITPPLKAFLYLSIMNHPLLWRFVNRIRK